MNFAALKNFFRALKMRVRRKRRICPLWLWAAKIRRRICRQSEAGI